MLRPGIAEPLRAHYNRGDPRGRQIVRTGGVTRLRGSRGAARDERGSGGSSLSLEATQARGQATGVEAAGPLAEEDLRAMTHNTAKPRGAVPA